MAWYFSDGKIVITKRANFGEPKYDKSLRSLMEELEVNGKWKKTLEIPVPNYYYDNVGVIYVFRVLWNTNLYSVSEISTFP